MLFDSKERAAKAEGIFKEGYNCCQSVAMAYSDVIGLEPDKTAALASGFGGGFGRLREVCGCVSGMTMVSGAVQPACDPSDKAQRTRNYALVQKLAGDFREAQGSIVCRELLGIRAAQAGQPSVKEGPEPSDRTPQYYHSRGCAGYVACAAAILAANLNCLAAEKIPAMFAAKGVEYREVGCVNWPEAFPYKPSVKFAIAADADGLYIHYIVKEDVTAAAAKEDRGRVWEDSCVEFFCAFDDGGYYNIECNCIGKLVFSYGAGRHDRETAPDEVFRNIGRWTSLGGEAFAEKHVDEWEAALAIPFSAFFRHDIPAGGLSGAQYSGKTSSTGSSGCRDNACTIRCNVYKCGDKLSKPHYISFFPIDTPKPDFHRPEFFRVLTMDQL